MRPIEHYFRFLTDFGQPKYRATQIIEAVCKKGIIDYDNIKVLPLNLRQELKKKLPLLSLKPKKSVISQDGKTEKILFSLSDGLTIEAVLMEFEDGRHSICLSCQTGCVLGCRFCATGTLVKMRSLEAEEIFDQVVFLNSRLKAKDASLEITNIVYMGMGEPFNNYQNVIDSIRMLCSSKYFGFSPRRITISTAGIIPGIERLALEQLPVNLAVSLHAADQQLRCQIMPIAKAYPLESLLSAVKKYSQATGRRVSFEYIMLKNVNDSGRDAEKLASIAKDKLLHVNLIPYNDTGLNSLGGSDLSRIRSFKLALQKKGVNVTVRTSLGGDIAAACGQLANI